ncbi:15625_t:CDS:2 [Dentiscutata erythropus]|uniref:15625_t:CDS:1 n=1 Tax=Dentiscutata erythropus TaxID=1348616 RepID=A0A9N9BMU9_9GLOM|nr:15625_t:CDS:2 [Dentiscutata erythropus]
MSQQKPPHDYTPSLKGEYNKPGGITYVATQTLGAVQTSMNDMKDELKESIRLVNTLLSNANAPADKMVPLIDEYKVPIVDPRELTEPYSSTDNVRGNNNTVHKKIYRGIEVACKKFHLAKKTDGSAGNLAWDNEPSARPSDMEMQQKLKELYQEHVFNKGISPHIQPKKVDSSDVPNLELSRNFQEKYMTMAANSENSTALFNLGDIYWNGKLGVEIDKVKAESYIKLAALKNQPKAIQFLEKIKAEKAKK